MQNSAREQEVFDMKRDMDLVRDLLLHIEENPLFDGTHWVHPAAPDEIGITDHSRKEVGYHLTMLIEEGFVKGKLSMDELPLINKLTWQGHEFLDNIRDHDVWSKTKERIKGLPSLALAIIAKIAEAEVMKRVGLS